MLDSRHHMLVLDYAFCASWKLDFQMFSAKFILLFSVVVNLFLMLLAVSFICLYLPSLNCFMTIFVGCFRNVTFLQAIDFLLDVEMRHSVSLKPLFRFLTDTLMLLMLYRLCKLILTQTWSRLSSLEQLILV